MELRPSVVNAKSIPAPASVAGLSGAWYQSRRSARLVSSASSGSSTSGASGKSTGRMSGSSRPSSTSTIRYSSPLPRNHGVSPNSVAIRCARR